MRFACLANHRLRGGLPHSASFMPRVTVHSRESCKQYLKQMKHYFFLVLAFSLLGCQNSRADKVDLICKDGTKKVTVEIENGQDYLIYDQPLKTNFIVTNIDPINLRISGAGIKILGTNKEKTGMRTEIKVPANYLKNDTLNVKVWYDNEDKSKLCEFNIPVKKAE